MAKESNPIRLAADRRLDALRVPDDLAQRITAAGPAKRRFRLRVLRRPIALAAVLCLVFACSVGVLAASPASHNLFAILGTQVSSLLQPIERSCVSEGIETTVVAAMNDSNTMDIYVAVRDREGSRIDGTAALCDVRLSGECYAPFVQLVQFDEKSKTATFLIEASSREDLNGKKVTLSIGRILLSGKDYLDQPVGLSAAKIAGAFPAPSFQSLEGRQRSSVSMTADGGTQASYDFSRALLPAESDGSVDGLLPWGELAAAGIADNALHLLVKPNETGQYAEMELSLSLSGKQAELDKLPRHTVEFDAAEDTDDDRAYYTYTEYVLPLPQKPDLNRIGVAYTGTVYAGSVAGKWDTTFRLESVSKQRVAYPDLTVNGWHIERVELSAIGVSVVTDTKGSGWPANPPAANTANLGDVPQIEVFDTSGDPIFFGSVSSSTDKNGCVLKNQFSTPLPLEMIGRVLVGGQEITFKK